MHPRLDHVVIHVSDWERSNAFYRDVLGAELVERDGSEARHYRFGDQQLNVHGPGQDPSPVAARPAEPGGADLCLSGTAPSTPRRDTWRSTAWRVEEGPVTRYGGRGRGTSVYFRDPDGSLLEFLSYA